MENKNQEFYKGMPTEEQIKSLFASFDGADERQRKNEEYRMENYFNCVDDYSWGGLCDKAQNEARGYRNSARYQLQEQLENGVFIREFEVNVLTDLDGNVVSDRLVNGKFGDCFMIKNGENDVKFVGIAKKQSTYEKKGYKVMTKVYKVEYFYTCKFVDFKGLIIKSRLLGEELVDKFSEYPTTHMEKPLFYAINNK
jgi:hypothetical protein